MRTVLMVILAILLPPLAVGLQVGLTMHFWLNVVLTILGYLPWQVHAVVVVVTGMK